MLGVHSRAAHLDILLSAAGIPEDLQPAAWNYCPGETWFQTLPPGKKSSGDSSVPTSQEDSSPSRA